MTNPEDVCVRCGLHVHTCQYCMEPKTLAERLDAAQSGEEFGAVLHGLFGALEKARDEDPS